MEESVAKGDFRPDLYFRISVVPIFVPPLRDRKGDIPLLAREFLNRFNAEHDANLSLTPSAMQVLTTCQFPGNVRELENCIRRTATLANSDSLVADDFACRQDECLSAVLWRRPADSTEGIVPLPIGRGASYGKTPPPPAAPEPPESGDAPAARPSTDEPEAERRRLVEAMETAGWVQAKAARILGLTARQIGYALRKHSIPVRKF